MKYKEYFTKCVVPYLYGEVELLHIAYVWGEAAWDRAMLESKRDPHEIWAAAQLMPGEGIEDGVRRIKELLANKTDECACGIRPPQHRVRKGTCLQCHKPVYVWESTVEDNR